LNELILNVIGAIKGATLPSHFMPRIVVRAFCQYMPVAVQQCIKILSRTASLERLQVNTQFYPLIDIVYCCHRKQQFGFALEVLK
jgi:hypothetical protein